MLEKVITPSVLKKYEAYLWSEEKSSATIMKYLRDVRAFSIYAKERTINKELTVAWKKELESSGYKARSINSMIASLNSLLDFMDLHNCRVKNIRIQRQTYLSEEKELSKEEYLKLLSATGKDERLNLLIKTICSTGIRVSELQFFTVEAVCRGEISVKSKSKTRTILIPCILKKLLVRYAEKTGVKHGAIFVTRNGAPLDRSYIWSQMKKLCEAAGVAASKGFPHNLRKLFARTFYGIEKDIAKLADILGHSSIETTRIYIMSSGIEHRRKLDRLGLVLAGSIGIKKEKAT